MSGERDAAGMMYDEIKVGGETTALVYGCNDDCEAGDPGDCQCPGATWFLRHRNEPDR